MVVWSILARSKAAAAPPPADPGWNTNVGPLLVGALLAVGLIAIQALLIHWMFSFNRIVKLLEEIRDRLKP